MTDFALWVKRIAGKEIGIAEHKYEIQIRIDLSHKIAFNSEAELTPALEQNTTKYTVSVWFANYKSSFF